MVGSAVHGFKCKREVNGTNLVLLLLVLSEELSGADFTAVDDTLRPMRLHVLLERTPIIVHLLDTNSHLKKHWQHKITIKL